MLACVSPIVMAAPAVAQDFDGGAWDKERFQIRLRGIGVIPSDGGTTTIGGMPDAENAVVPEFDISYFITRNIALELILATSPHDIRLNNSAVGDLDLGDTMVLPPTLTLQYHFNRDAPFSPYIGAGVNYTITYAEDPGADTARLKAGNSFGVAVQAGADIWLNDHWGINIDAKKIWLDVSASVNGGAITGTVKLNPWVIGGGIAYRF